MQKNAFNKLGFYVPWTIFYFCFLYGIDVET